jgi:hypothetical protein
LGEDDTVSVRSITSDEKRTLWKLMGNTGSGRNENMTTPQDPTPQEVQQVDLAVEVVELQDRVAELLAELNGLSEQLALTQKTLAQAQMDAAAAEDAQKMAQDRVLLLQRMIISAQHSEKAWRETAMANDKLHNAACDELNILRGKVTVMQSMLDQQERTLASQQDIVEAAQRPQS